MAVDDLLYPTPLYSQLSMFLNVFPEKHVLSPIYDGERDGVAFVVMPLVASQGIQTQQL